MRRRLSFLLTMLLAAAACGGGDEDGRPKGQRTAAEADADGAYATPDEPVVTPAESAQAHRDVQRHADSVRDAVLRASGGETEPPRRPPPADNSVAARHRMCMEQAAAADEPVRTRLREACANIRNQPER
jgi:hypothetical protein